MPPLIIHGTMDNFDHEENTKSGIGGSHDTILMMFQSSKGRLNNSQSQISQVPNSVKNQSLELVLSKIGEER